MKRSKGEITTAAVILISVGSLILGLMAPKFNPFRFERSSANKKASWTLQTEKTKPVLLTDKKGEAVAVGNEIERVYNTGKEEITPKKTLGEKIGEFFSRLTTAGLVFVVVSLLFFGGAPLVWVYRRYKTVKNALKNTVAAIREVDDETYTKLKPVLAANHEKKDRIVIDEIKKELN